MNLCVNLAESTVGPTLRNFKPISGLIPKSAESMKPIVAPANASLQAFTPHNKFKSSITDRRNYATTARSVSNGESTMLTIHFH